VEQDGNYFSTFREFDLPDGPQDITDAFDRFCAMNYKAEVSLDPDISWIDADGRPRMLEGLRISGSNCSSSGADVPSFRHSSSSADAGV
jgi:hypothetical protein